MIIRPPTRLGSGAGGVRRSVQRRGSGPDTARSCLALPNPLTSRASRTHRHFLHMDRTEPVRDHVYTTQDLSRLVRSDPRHSHERVQLHRELRVAVHCWICRGISRKARPAKPSHRWSPRHARNVNSTICVPIPPRRTNLLAGDGLDGADLIAADLAVRLHDWRQQTNDVIPSDFAGSRIAARYTETYLRIHERVPTSRSAIAVDRGIEDEVGQTGR